MWYNRVMEHTSEIKKKWTKHSYNLSEPQNHCIRRRSNSEWEMNGLPKRPPHESTENPGKTVKNYLYRILDIN